MIVRVSPIKANGSENDAFLGRLARAQDDNLTDDYCRPIKVSGDIPVDAILKRGTSRRVPRRFSLSELDGDWN